MSEPTYADLVAADPLGMPRHDHGCTCWPHVAEDDARRAIERVGLDEYRDSKKLLREAAAAERERLRALHLTTHISPVYHHKCPTCRLLAEPEPQDGP